MLLVASGLYGYIMQVGCQMFVDSESVSDSIGTTFTWILLFCPLVAYGIVYLVDFFIQEIGNKVLYWIDTVFWTFIFTLLTIRLTAYPYSQICIALEPFSKFKCIMVDITAWITVYMIWFFVYSNILANGEVDEHGKKKSLFSWIRKPVKPKDSKVEYEMPEKFPQEIKTENAEPEELAEQVFDEQIERATNVSDGYIYSVRLDDEDVSQVTVRNGHIAYDERTGLPDTVLSDRTLVVEFADGRKKLVSIDDIAFVDDVRPAEQAKNEAHENIRAGVAEAEQNVTNAERFNDKCLEIILEQCTHSKDIDERISELKEVCHVCNKREIPFYTMLMSYMYFCNGDNKSSVMYAAVTIDMIDSIDLTDLMMDPYKFLQRCPEIAEKAYVAVCKKTFYNNDDYKTLLETYILHMGNNYYTSVKVHDTMRENATRERKRIWEQ